VDLLWSQPPSWLRWRHRCRRRCRQRRRRRPPSDSRFRSEARSQHDQTPNSQTTSRRLQDDQAMAGSQADVARPSSGNCSTICWWRRSHFPREVWQSTGRSTTMSRLSIRNCSSVLSPSVWIHLPAKEASRRTLRHRVIDYEQGDTFVVWQ
jgi:hypothetical protein